MLLGILKPKVIEIIIVYDNCTWDMVCDYLIILYDWQLDIVFLLWALSICFNGVVKPAVNTS